MKRLFITGIAGFIGFHLAKALTKRGDSVCGCDQFNAYYSPALKQRRAELLSQEGIKIHTLDIVNRDALHRLLEKEKITHVVHLAAQAGVRYSLENPQAYVDSNLSGFVNVLEALRALPHIKLTYASSSSVYGLNTKTPFAETDPVNQPASLYAATKRSNELIAHAYHHTHNLSSTGLRFFTVYGPWGRPDMAYYSFTKAIWEGTPISVFGDGTLQRDFTYIDDIIQGTLAAIDLEADLELFNLGNHTPVTVLTLIDILEKHLQKKAIIEWRPQPPGDVPITYADITKSKRELNYSPQTHLDAGLKEFVDWFIHYTAK